MDYENTLCWLLSLNKRERETYIKLARQLVRHGVAAGLGEAMLMIASSKVIASSKQQERRFSHLA